MEEWRPVAGFEGLYEVSSFGRVRSLDRIVAQLYRGTLHDHLYRGRTLRHAITGDSPYPRVRLSKSGAITDFNVHTLVASAFLGPCPDNLEVCHNDGNGQNNVPTNLRYDTCAGNMADKRLHGTHLFGARHPGAKFTEDEVAKIKALAGKVTQRALAAKYGVGHRAIGDIFRGHTWAHVVPATGV